MKMNLLPQLYKNRNLLLLLILFFPLTIFGNMANPYIEGSSHSSMYSIKDCRVLKERIVVKLLIGDEGYYAHYHVIYQIISDVEKEVPLVFVGKQLYANQTVSVNNVEVQPIYIDKNSKSFIQKNLNRFEMKFVEHESYEVQPKELIYFKAKLRKGENLIIIDYDAELAQNRFGFERKLTLEYSLYPSRFWKSFENVEFFLEPSDRINVESSNAESYTEIDNAYVWKIENFDNDLKIEFTPQYNWFQNILLTLERMGIALISALIFGFIHWKLLNNRRKKYPEKYNWLVPVGILVVTILFYTVFFLSYDFIDWVLNQKSKHGYYFLFIIITIPFFFLIYGFLTWFAHLHIKKQINRSSEK